MLTALDIIVNGAVNRTGLKGPAAGLKGIFCYRPINYAGDELLMECVLLQLLKACQYGFYIFESTHRNECHKWMTIEVDGSKIIFTTMFFSGQRIENKHQDHYMSLLISRHYKCACRNCYWQLSNQRFKYGARFETPT